MTSAVLGKGFPAFPGRYFCYFSCPIPEREEGDVLDLQRGGWLSPNPQVFSPSVTLGQCKAPLVGFKGAVGGSHIFRLPLLPGPHFP